MPHVARMNVAPVKSTSLHHPDEIFLTERGVEGDHRFLFLDEDGHRLTEGAKAPLLGTHADYDRDAEVLALAFPDGTNVKGSALAVGDVRTVKLYDREIEVRAVDGGLSEATSRHAGRPLFLHRVDEPEYAGGGRRVSIVSAGSRDDLGRRGALDTAPDPRRFRKLLEIDGCAPYEEDTWDGRLIAIGDALVRAGDGMPRCALTTLDPDTGRKDFPTLDVLATYRKVGTQLMFGVYGDVERAGRIAVGDEVAPVD
jgi:uncharacterized protein YcbX